MKKKKNKNQVATYQIDGKLEVSKPVPRTLDAIWGGVILGQYETLNETEYESYLNNLNKTDLQAHAINIGLIPVDNRQILTQRLMREFKKFVASYQTPSEVVSKKNKLSPEVTKILAEGR